MTPDEDLLEDRSAKPWMDLLGDAERSQDKYQHRSDRIDKLYAEVEVTSEGADGEFKIFWANMGILMPAIYSQAPKPEVSPRFKDRRALPRRAAEILERALVSDIEADDLHATLRDARDDLALNARGVAWVRIGERDGMEVPIAEHLDRKDFRHGPARKWSEVPWAARRAWLTKKEFKGRFEEVPPTVKFGDGKGDDEENHKGKTAVWEIWHRTEQVVVWVCEGAEDVLDVKEPWMQLTGFFPCPKPAYATVKRGTLIPVPDLAFYQDQVDEINSATRRISALTESLRLKGFYAAGNGDVAEALETAINSLDDRAILVPVSSLAALGGGNVKDAVMWMPVQEVAGVIRELIDIRRQLIQDVYEITGLSDIMRGATDPNETLGSQQLKSQYGSVRVQERQGEMARLARDIIRMKAEILAENVDLQALLEMGQVDDLKTADEIQQDIEQQLMQAEQQGEEAVAALEQQLQAEAEDAVSYEEVEALFQDQRTRPFILDIETDSTIAPDEAADKQSRVEFVTVVGGFIEQTAPLIAQFPQLGGLAAETMQYLASGFDAGRPMQAAIDELADNLRNASKQPQQPDPAAEADAEAAKREADREDAKAQAEIGLKQAQAADLQRGPAEPVSVDPLDRAKLDLEIRKLDQADEQRDLELAKTVAEFAERDADRDNAKDTDNG